MSNSGRQRSTCELPQELVIDIFYRLPIKSLTRCKLLSKSWNSLISNPNFVKSYIRLSSGKRDPVSILTGFVGNWFSIPASQNNDVVCGTYYNINSSNFDLSMVGLPSRPIFRRSFLNIKWFIYLGSCDGLICLFDRRKALVYIYNPTTKDYREIPSPIVYSHNNPNLVIMEESWFGYVPSMDDYIIVLFIMFHHLQVHIFSIRDANWRKLDDVSNFVNNYYYILYPFIDHTRAFDPKADGPLPKGAFINEELYYVAIDNPGRIVKMLKFDLIRETFQVVQFKNGVEDIDYHIVADHEYGNGEERGLPIEAGVTSTLKEHKLCYWRLSCKKMLDVWMLEQYGNWNSWKKIYRFDLTKESSLDGYNIRVKGFTFDGKVVLRDPVDRGATFVIDTSKDPPSYLSLRSDCVIGPMVSYIRTMLSPSHL